MMVNDLLDNKTLREEMIDRIEVLDKVKKLVMLEGADFMTADQVAEYYEVSDKTIKRTTERHLEELQSDGFTIINPTNYHSSLKSTKTTKSGFSNVIPFKTEKTKYKLTITDNNGMTVDIPNRGIRIFPKRAILRVGMLLRDSKIAIEVRSQLLNAVEKVDVKVAVEDIETEQNYINKISMAFSKNDRLGMLTASADLDDFRKRHIKKLTDDNTSLKADNFALADGQLTWANRDTMNALIRKLAQFANVNYSTLWNRLYKQVNYKYHIDIKARENYRRPYIAQIRDDEWPIFIKTFAAMCEDYGYTFNQIAKNCGFGIEHKPAFGKEKPDFSQKGA